MVYRSRNRLKFQLQSMSNTWWTGLNLSWMMSPYSPKGLVITGLWFYSFQYSLVKIEISLWQKWNLWRFFSDHLLFTFINFCFNFLGAPFPPNFKEVVKTIFKRLFRVYAHIYHSHFQKIVSLKEEAHLNTCFKHFILFTCVS